MKKSSYFIIILFYLTCCGNQRNLPSTEIDETNEIGYFQLSGLKVYFDFTEGKIVSETNRETVTFIIQDNSTGPNTEAQILANSHYLDFQEAFYRKFYQGQPVKIYLYKGYSSTLEQYIDSLPEFYAEYTLGTGQIEPEEFNNYTVETLPRQQPQPIEGYTYYEKNFELAGVLMQISGFYSDANQDEQIYNTLYAENLSDQSVCLELYEIGVQIPQDQGFRVASLCLIDDLGYQERSGAKAITANLVWGRQYYFLVNTYHLSDIIPGGDDFETQSRLDFTF